MPRLTVQAGEDKGKVFTFSSNRIVVGRSVNNDIQIVDRRMSRNHAEFYTEDGGFWARDLGSKNGTLHNGMIITNPVRLRSGDIVQVGDTPLIFEDESAPISGADMTTFNPNAASDGRRDTPSYKLVDEHQWGRTQGELRAGVSPSGAVNFDGDAIRAIKDSHKRLEIIYQVTEAIRSVFSLEELLGRIMDIITEVLHPDRSYLLLVHPDTHDLTPEVIRTREGDEDREVKVSTSIVERCIKEGVALLVSDATADDRFSASESIILNRIRTAMVAPLVYKSDVLGVVYIDTRTRMVPYTREELELLTGITNQAAVAIINARLHSQLVEQHKLAREMEIARTIQVNLLPKAYPHLGTFEISAMSLPAKHVGGDYYDFLRIPDGRIGIAIADVAGKGVPAAILTATTRSYLQSETQHPSSTLAQTVERINRMVHRDVTNDMYVTMVMLYVHPETGAIEYVNAGHSHPVLFYRDGGTTRLEEGGLFLGMFEGATYDSAHFSMSEGDVLLLDTDGVTDIQNAAGEQIGLDRIKELVESNKHLSAEAIRNAIFDECQKHRGDADQFDDFTLIILKRKAVEALDSELEFDYGDYGDEDSDSLDPDLELD